uniref:Cold shock domain containing C2, RNA binding a n=1 Tax=Sinocyclocheilus anshuiensis TaxID=1608454 RepID=A0A671LDF5_9TELE
MADSDSTSTSDRKPHCPHKPLSLSLPFNDSKLHDKNSTLLWYFLRSVRAKSGPVFKGICKNFSRSQGHGFIHPSHGGEDIFGDEVTYKVCPVPPKNIKFQAVEVVITNLSSGRKHETWSGQVISS